MSTPGVSMKRAPLLVLTGTIAGFAGVLGLHIGGSSPASPRAAATGQPAGTGAGKNKSASHGGGTGPAAGNAGRTRSATGPSVNFGFGTLAVRVTVTGSRIVNISVPALNPLEPTSQQICAQAIPMLRSEVISAQSANISGVSGATYTSEGYVQSLQAALNTLHAG